MVPFVGHVVELCLAAEMLLLCEPGLAQEFQRAVDRGQADVRVFLGEQPVHLFGRHVFHFKKVVRMFSRCRVSFRPFFERCCLRISSSLVGFAITMNFHAYGEPIKPEYGRRVKRESQLVDE